ncbi:hypothetical protein [Pseudomonas sp. AS2.8]|uniref:hypothetical protein n=1 Tax=Pseudomonas sp. AS2.8 TaxID=2587128 RepID=UPI001623060E|nr:hypothetical protein [Pseudomonas sp. AS2.8]MBB2896504.1 hypothetical protein [Pseudomonas sp. AS2.8]
MKTMLLPALALAALPTFGAGGGEPPSVKVTFGQPTIRQKLFYEKLYEKKPYPDATLYYYSNGVYKIISPGEEHYGVYVVHGKLTDDQYQVDFISLPSADWGGKTARHFLKFDRKAGTFTQQATWEEDPNIAPQYGRFSQDANDITDPRPIKWETHAEGEQRQR